VPAGVVDPAPLPKLKPEGFAGVCCAFPKEKAGAGAGADAFEAGAAAAGAPKGNAGAAAGCAG